MELIKALVQTINKEEADEKGNKKSDDDNHNQDNQVDVVVKQN